MDGKQIILCEQCCKTSLEVSLNYKEHPFMDIVDFIIMTSTTKIQAVFAEMLQK